MDDGSIKAIIYIIYQTVQEEAGSCTGRRKEVIV